MVNFKLFKIYNLYFNKHYSFLPKIYHHRVLSPKNLVFHARTKHIETHYHYIREKFIESREIDFVHLSKGDQVVDIFTKPLGRTKYSQFRNELGVPSLSKIVEKGEI